MLCAGVFVSDAPDICDEFFYGGERVGSAGGVVVCGAGEL